MSIHEREMEIKPDKLVVLQKIIQNDALVETAPSLAGINEAAVNRPGGSIYYGTGLSTSQELSIALPFDVLSLVLMAEKIRRALGMNQVNHFIADTHAKSNKLFPDDLVDKRAQETKRQLERMFKNFGLDAFNIILASDFDQTAEYQEIYEKVETDKHEYVKREVADIEWLRRIKDLSLKIGWIIQSSETNLGFDERVFDREYQAKLGGAVSFLYLKPGRTFDKTRPKASPYIHIPSESRLLLSPTEDVKSKLAEAEKVWGDRNIGGAKGYFGDIVRAYEKLFGAIGNISLENKIQSIINKATQ